MTILERRQRMQERKSFISLSNQMKRSSNNNRKFWSTNTRGSGTSGSNGVQLQDQKEGSLIPSISDAAVVDTHNNRNVESRSNAMKRLLWKLQRNHFRQRNLNNSNNVSSLSKNLLYIDDTTYAVIKIEVQGLLSSHSALGIVTTPIALINTIVTSRNVLNEYAESTFHPYDIDNNHEVVVRRFGGIRPTSRIPFTYSTSTQRRYDFINTLNRLQQHQQKGSSSSDSNYITCWDDAKGILSKVLQFPDDDIITPFDKVELSSSISTANEIPSIDGNGTENFIQRLRDIHLEEMSPPLLLRPSQYKWIEIANTAISKTYDKDDDVDSATGAATAMTVVSPPLFRNLTDEEHERLASVMALKNGNYDTDIVARTDDDTDSVQRCNLRTLLPYEWVNDEVIHYYLTLLQKRDEQICIANKERRRTHFFKSFFMTKLLDEGNSNPALAGKYNYGNVKRWSKKVHGKDIFGLSKIFFPINEGNQHWTSAVIYIEEQRIQYYDSLGGSGQKYLEVLLRYLQDEHLDKKKVPLKCPELWTLVPCTNDTPRQHNGYDCGVFTCLFADFISIDKSFDGFEPQSHMSTYREHIALSILDGNIVT